MRFVGIWLAAACAATAANAADIEQPNIPPPVPPAVYAPALPPIYSWTGFYLGGNGGYGFASGKGTATIVGGPFNGLNTSSSANIQGGIAGAQVGFNWQTGPFVLGVEGDGEWSGQSNTLNFSCGAGCNLSETGAIKWLATARARVISAEEVHRARVDRGWQELDDWHKQYGSMAEFAGVAAALSGFFVMRAAEKKQATA
jgi:opacity protein-like surface antigen